MPLFFQVDSKQLTITPVNDVTGHMNNSSVFLNGKRRDRVTDRYTWVDELPEAIRLLSNACTAHKVELSREIARLSAALEQVDMLEKEQIRIAKDAQREANNDYFG